MSVLRLEKFIKATIDQYQTLTFKNRMFSLPIDLLSQYVTVYEFLSRGARFYWKQNSWTENRANLNTVAPSCFFIYMSNWVSSVTVSATTREQNCGQKVFFLGVERKRELYQTKDVKRATSYDTLRYLSVWIWITSRLNNFSGRRFAEAVLKTSRGNNYVVLCNKTRAKD